MKKNQAPKAIAKNSLIRAMSVLLFSLYIVFFTFGQPGPSDLILLLDTSAGMSPYYREVKEYVTGSFLRDFLRVGDTFHLISFSNAPRVEISRRVEGVGDLETIIGRLFLMYPLEPRPDIPGVLRYAERYIGDLPKGRPKKIVLITKGAVPLTIPESVLQETADRLEQGGHAFRLVTLPFNQAPARTAPPAGQIAQPEIQGGTPPARDADAMPVQNNVSLQSRIPQQPAQTVQPQAQNRTPQPQTPAQTRTPQQPAQPQAQNRTPQQQTTPQTRTPQQSAQPVQPQAQNRTPQQQTTPQTRTPQQSAQTVQQQAQNRTPPQQTPPQTRTPQQPAQTAQPQAQNRAPQPQTQTQGGTPPQTTQTAQPQAQNRTPQQQQTPPQTRTPQQPAQTAQPQAQNRTPQQQTTPQTRTPQQPAQTAQPQAQNRTPQQQTPPQTRTPQQQTQTAQPQAQNRTPQQSAQTVQQQAQNRTPPQTQGGTPQQPAQTAQPQAQNRTPPQTRTPQQPAQAQPQAQNRAPPQQTPPQTRTSQPLAQKTAQPQAQNRALPQQMPPQTRTPPQQTQTAQPQAQNRTPPQPPPQTRTPQQPAQPQAQPQSSQTERSHQTGIDREFQDELQFPLPLPFPFLAGLGLGILGILSFFSVLLLRNMHRSPNQTMAYVAGRTVPSRPKDAGRIEEPAKPGRIRQDRLNESAARRQTETLTAWTRTADAPVPAAPAPLQAKSAALVFDGPPMLSIFVEDQNTNIGRRNVHILKQGYTYTLGGGKSDFLIFLVPLPAHIGEIYFDGQGCSFIPRRPEFFPDLGAAPVRDCIGKTIRVVSEKKYELRFRIEQYEDPLKSLNRLLTSIDVSPKQTAWVKQNSPGAQNPRRPGAGFTLPRPR